MQTKLKKYNEKRNFLKTSEPKGMSNTKSTKKQIFVVQYHHASHTHFDLRLQMDDVLVSFAVPKGLSYFELDKRLAVHVEDHPLEYAKFEGVIPAGEYGGGEVLIWDAGVWHPIEGSKGLKQGLIKFSLNGKRLKGNWALINISKLKNEDNWIIIKEKDKYLNYDDLSKYKTSIKTGKTFADLRAEQQKNPFKFIKPMLCKMLTQIPPDADFLWEVKYDGYRMLSYCEKGKTTLYSRNKTNYSSKFSGVALNVSNLAKGRAMVLDGEIVVFDEFGKTDFQRLQNALRHKNTIMASYVVFDVIALDGKDLRDTPLIKRKSILKNLLKNAPEGVIFSNHTIGKGKQCFMAAKNMGLEGIVGKKKNSKYVSARNGDWVKIKCYLRQEFVVCGYTISNKKFGIGAILLGVYNKNRLEFCGKTGTGFGEEESRELLTKFSKLKTQECPFKEKPKISSSTIWLKPKLVCEVQFAEWTNDNLLRQASFKGLREDKSAKDVVKEI